MENYAGSTQIWFGQGCAAQASKPIPISKGHFGRKRYPFVGTFSKYRPMFKNIWVLKIFEIL